MEQNSFIQNHEPKLRGKRIVVTAEELERAEHRGIASFAKALISCLKEAGAEVWLLTEFHPNIWGGGLRWLPKKTRELIYTSRLLDSLAEGTRKRNYSLIERRVNSIRKAREFLEAIKIFAEYLFTPLLGEPKIRKINLQSQFDNLYLRKERLKYLENIDGILCARNIFKRSLWMSTLRNSKPININLKGFDSLFITSPQNITAKGVKNTIQIIHDLIPLEEGHVASAHMVSFTRRLEVCAHSNRIFVSSSTANKYQQHIDNKGFSKRLTSHHIVVQPPSIKLPTWVTDHSGKSIDLEPSCRLLLSEGKLKPFSYLLFNSSIDPRKNLIFLIKSYLEANLFAKGIKLCITGKLKKDEYSKSVRELVRNEPGILVTGYVSENEKADLYLNALALLSPSLVEGFGIPVLDAACIGLDTIASDSDSHLEIQSMKDFSNCIVIAQTLETREWALAMQAIAFKNRLLIKDQASARKSRISRYSKINEELKSRFKVELSRLIKSEMAN